MGKFMLVDGNSLVHRAFHALPLLQNSSGEYTNAVYGFVMMFQRIIRELAPTHGAVAFDVSKKTFRSEIYQEYKATRKETPSELRGQFAYVKEIIRASGFSVIEAPGFEADDIIGTLSVYAASQGHEVFIVTGDRDAFQLISPQVSVILTRKGISETEVYNEDALYQRYGLTPKQIIDLKALMGDSSDNIPGVPGVGEKTALKLLLEYGTLANIYENVSEIKGKLGEKLREYKELAYISHDLAKINTSVDIQIDETQFQLTSSKVGLLKNIYENLGFKTLLKELPQHVEPNEQQPDNLQVKILVDPKELKEILGIQGIVIYLISSPPYLDALPEEILIYAKEQVFIIKLSEIDEQFQEVLTDYFASKQTKVFFDLKTALFNLSNAGYSLLGNCHDVSLMAYLNSPGTGKYAPADIALDYLQLAIEKDNVLRSVQAITTAYPLILKKLKENQLEDLYQNIELPLVLVLADMEKTGIVLDVEELNKLGKQIEKNISQLRKDIYDLAEEEFNLNSPKQLGKILFEKLELPIIKKTKTGYSTDAEVLEELATLHDIVAKILDYRTLAKLQSTYVEGLKNSVNPKTGRLHTSLNQTITATGRLSSTEPNLQNIPVRVDIGRQIRKSFKPSLGNVLLAADYSQIELRILAHLSQDANLVDAFVKGQDIHTRTAQEVFGVDADEVTAEMRRRAKAVNFGIVYGISDFGLSRDLRIPRKEAKTYIDNYFNRYKGVKTYLEQTITNARQVGYVNTLFGRRRYIPDILSSNRNVRNFGERTAMNTPIQGTAADIIKIAMLRIFEALRDKGLATKMLLQVHDELIFDVPKEELVIVAELVREQMEHACKLDVPLIADLKVGQDWYNMALYSGGE